MIPNFEISTFLSFSRIPYIAKLQEAITPGNNLTAVAAEQFHANLMRLGPLCTTRAQIQYLARMKKISSLASTKPLESKILILERRGHSNSTSMLTVLQAIVNIQ